MTLDEIGCGPSILGYRDDKCDNDFVFMGCIMTEKERRKNQGCEPK